jgi:serine/threonine-protein kinase HipA
LIEAIKVTLYGHTLGYLAAHKGQYIFKYDQDFQALGIEPSPIKMPVSPATFSFSELRATSFEGLPGLIRDSIPDHYGTQVIKKYFSSIGVDPETITPLDKLAYIGKRGFGALTYTPAEELAQYPAQTELDLFTLWNESRKVLYDEISSKDISWVYSFGGSAGGARAKAAILFDPQSGAFSIDEKQAVKDRYSHWLLKFDGLSKDDNGRPMPYERMEYIYSLLARDAGIEMPETDYVEEPNGMFHFLTRRFDRRIDQKSGQVEKQHIQTISALLHHDHDDQQSLDYTDVLTTIKMITGSASETLEGFRRMVFNILSHNHDDHSKNFSLSMNTRGIWSLAPAYDLVYTNEKGWFVNGHQITINQKSKAITKQDVLYVAERADISFKKALKVIDQVQTALKGWESYAEQFGLLDRFPDYVTQVRAGLNKVSL